MSEALRRLRVAAAAVIAMECDRVNVCKNSEPYDPIANPGQFDERTVALAWALEWESDGRAGSLGSVEPGEVAVGNEG